MDKAVRAFVVTEEEIIEMLDRVQMVADRIGEHYPYSETILDRVAGTMARVMDNTREFEI